MLLCSWSPAGNVESPRLRPPNAVDQICRPVNLDIGKPGIVQIVITPQAGGPHHMLILSPFDLLACFAAAFVFANSLPIRGRYVATSLSGICFIDLGGI
jgi:hypothetical protein